VSRNSSLLGDRIHDRLALSVITDPEKGELLTEFQKPITKEVSNRVNQIEKKFYIDIEGAKDEKAREKIYTNTRDLASKSPTRSDCDEGSFSAVLSARAGNLFGLLRIDLSNQQARRSWCVVGIIAAQSIGEPERSLRCERSTRVVLLDRLRLLRTNQYKTGKFIRQFMEDFASATDTDMKAFDPTKLLETQEAIVRSLFKKPGFRSPDDQQRRRDRRSEAEEASRKELPRLPKRRLTERTATAVKNVGEVEKDVLLLLDG